MVVLEKLRDSGGYAGGIAIYNAAKMAAAAANMRRRDRKLCDETISRLQPLFLKLNLKRVTFKINASLPANWFKSADTIAAMTFGYRIYFKKADIEKTERGLSLLIHELVHVDQVRRRGNSETAFAGDYGAGFLEAGSYRKNPLEVEAYDFQDKVGVPALCINKWLIPVTTSVLV